MTNGNIKILNPSKISLLIKIKVNKKPKYAIISANKTVKYFLVKNKIDLSICGHIHECFGNSDQIGKTLVINPSPNGAIIEI